MKKKILISIGNFWYPAVISTGIISIFYLARELNKKYEIHILTNKNLWEKNILGTTFYKFSKKQLNWEIKSGLKIHYVENGYAKKFPSISFIINKILNPYHIYKLNKKIKFDSIIEVSSNPILLIRSYFISKLFFKGKLIHLFLTIANSGIFSDFILRKISFKIDKIIFTNQFFYKKYLKHNNSDCLKYIPVGFYKDTFEAKKLKKVTFKKTNINIGYFGPLREYKGIIVFAKSINFYNKISTKNQITFHFITYKLGTEYEHKKNLIQIKKIIGKTNNIKFYQNLYDKYTIYKEIDYLVFPQNKINGSTGHPVTLL